MLQEMNESCKLIVELVQNKKSEQGFKALFTQKINENLEGNR